MNPNIKWLDQGQPQTLQIGTLILYVRAAFIVLFGFVFSPLGLLFFIAFAGGALSIANEKKYGYYVAIVAVAIGLVFDFAPGLSALNDINSLISIIFDAALLAVLLYPESRSYAKIWFK